MHAPEPGILAFHARLQGARHALQMRQEGVVRGGRYQPHLVDTAQH